MRYHTHPRAVLDWDPETLGLNIQALSAARALGERRMAQVNAQGGRVFPTFSLGGV